MGMAGSYGRGEDDGAVPCGLLVAMEFRGQEWGNGGMADGYVILLCILL